MITLTEEDIKFLIEIIGTDGEMRDGWFDETKTEFQRYDLMIRIYTALGLKKDVKLCRERLAEHQTSLAENTRAHDDSTVFTP